MKNIIGRLQREVGIARAFGAQEDVRNWRLALTPQEVDELSESASSPPRGFTPAEQGKAIGSADDRLSSLIQAVSGLIPQWRAEAEAAGNRTPVSQAHGDYLGARTGALEECADELAAVLASASATEKNDLTRSGELAADPPPQHAATDREDQ